MGPTLQFSVERANISPEFYLTTSFIFSNVVGNTDFMIIMDPSGGSALPTQETLLTLQKTYVTGLQSLSK